jgi:membrane-bound lytic murein transglycosylase B
LRGPERLLRNLILLFVFATLGAGVVAGAAAGVASAIPSASTGDLADVPPDYLALYQAAGTAYGVPWPVLAAIGKVESDHGRNPAAYRPNEAGAEGPMQFIPSSWARYRGASGNPHPDVYDARDAIFAAAAYLRVAGAPADIPRAIFAYNHADWYVDLVLRQARAYGYPG